MSTETATVRRYTAEQLGFYDTADAETAAFFASELLDSARRHGKINGEHFDPEKGAHYIGELVAEKFPKVGALDTVCRENFYLGLIGELDAQIDAAEAEAQLEEITSAPLVAGRAGWGVRRVAGLTFEACQADPSHATRAFSVCSECWNARPAFWVELGRQLFGPFDTEAEARKVIEDEEAALQEAEGGAEADTDTVDLPTYEGHFGVAGEKIKTGDAVAVTFRPGTGATFPSRREPLFGYVRTIDRQNLIVAVRDVELGDQVLHAHDVETWAVLPGRKGNQA